MRALVFHGPGDLRLKEVPKPMPVEAGDVLVEIEVALTDGSIAKALARGHPVLLGPPPSRFGHEFCGIEVATGQRVVAANSAPCGACDVQATAWRCSDSDRSASCKDATRGKRWTEA